MSVGPLWNLQRQEKLCKSNIRFDKLYLLICFPSRKFLVAIEYKTESELKKSRGLLTKKEGCYILAILFRLSRFDDNDFRVGGKIKCKKKTDILFRDQ